MSWLCVIAKNIIGIMKILVLFVSMNQVVKKGKLIEVNNLHLI